MLTTDFAGLRMTGRMSRPPARPDIREYVAHLIKKHRDESSEPYDSLVKALKAKGLKITKQALSAIATGGGPGNKTIDGFAALEGLSRENFEAAANAWYAANFPRIRIEWARRYPNWDLAVKFKRGKVRESILNTPPMLRANEDLPTEEWGTMLELEEMKLKRREKDPRGQKARDAQVAASTQFLSESLQPKNDDD